MASICEFHGVKLIKRLFILHVFSFQIVVMVIPAGSKKAIRVRMGHNRCACARIVFLRSPIMFKSLPVIAFAPNIPMTDRD